MSAFFDEDRYRDAVPGLAGGTVGGLATERHNAGGLRIEVELADEVLTRDRGARPRLDELLLDSRKLRVAFDDDDAVGYSIQEWSDGGIETGLPVVDEPFNFGIRVGFEEYS